MPNYFPRGVSLRLGVTPLAKTITKSIVLRKGGQAKQECETAERELQQCDILQEQRVPFPGDDRGFELHWLGDVPYMQSLVSSTSSKQGDQEPLALSLHARLSEKTFTSGTEGDKIQIKIEVFFNGQLSACTFIPSYDLGAANKQMHHIFAGYRVDYLAERPWVVLPTTLGPDGTPSIPQDPADASRRWKQISDALLKEANDRGMDDEGGRPPSAALLLDIAAMSLPDMVKDATIPGGKSFGVIDVVITAGSGHKITQGAGYLKSPQRLADDNFDVQSGIDEDEDEDQVTMATTDPMLKSTSSDGGGLVASYDLDQDSEPPKKQRTSAFHAPQVLSLRSRPMATVPSAGSAHFTRDPVQPMSSGIFSEPIANYDPVAPVSSPYHWEAGSIPPVGYNPGSLSNSSTLSMMRNPVSTGALPYGTPSSFYTFSDPITSMQQPHSSPYFPQPLRSAYEQTPPGPSPSAARFAGWNMMSSPQLHRPAAHDAQFANQFELPASTESHDIGNIPDLPGRRPSYSMFPYVNPFAPVDHNAFQLSQAAQSPYLAPHSAMQQHSPFDHSTFSPSNASAIPHNQHTRPPLLPPTGIFSVTTKPRSHRNLSTSANPKKAYEGFYLNHLVILGKNGTKMVDRRWSPAKFVKTKTRADSEVPTSAFGFRSSMSMPQSGSQLGDIVLPKETGNDMEEPRATTYRLADASTQRKKGDQDRLPEKAIATSAMSRADLLSMTESVGDDKHDKAKGTTNCAPQLAKQTRRTRSEKASRSTSGGILGVQGPKATTFWFEDPEEVMREAAKLKRAQPTKEETEPASDAKDVEMQEPAEKAAESISSPVSSPLTSLSHTPDAGTPPKRISSSPEDQPPMNQLDGSHDSRQPSPTKPTSALPSNLAFTTPLLPSSTSRGRASRTPSPNKKRKAAGASPTKPGRSPGRHATNDNPPLNRGCVIAFAESKPADRGGQGVLRQVRGERQGVFREEYVLVATRFFVVG